MAAVALYDYAAADIKQLSFHQGDTVTVLQKDVGGWTEAIIGGKRGWVPTSYIDFNVPESDDKQSTQPDIVTNPTQINTEVSNGGQGGTPITNSTPSPPASPKGSSSSTTTNSNIIPNTSDAPPTSAKPTTPAVKKKRTKSRLNAKLNHLGKYITPRSLLSDLETSIIDYEQSHGPPLNSNGPVRAKGQFKLGEGNRNTKANIAKIITTPKAAQAKTKISKANVRTNINEISSQAKGKNNVVQPILQSNKTSSTQGQLRSSQGKSGNKADQLEDSVSDKSKRRRKKLRPRGIALYDYLPDPTLPNTLGFMAGDVIIITVSDNGGWTEGKLKHKKGWFPTSFVQIRKKRRRPKSLPPTSPRVVNATIESMARLEASASESQDTTSQSSDSAAKDLAPRRKSLSNIPKKSINRRRSEENKAKQVKEPIRKRGKSTNTKSKKKKPLERKKKVGVTFQQPPKQMKKPKSKSAKLVAPINLLESQFHLPIQTDSIEHDQSQEIFPNQQVQDNVQKEKASTTVLSKPKGHLENGKETKIEDNNQEDIGTLVLSKEDGDNLISKLNGNQELGE